MWLILVIVIAVLIVALWFVLCNPKEDPSVSIHGVTEKNKVDEPEAPANVAGHTGHDEMPPGRSNDDTAAPVKLAPSAATNDDWDAEPTSVMETLTQEPSETATEEPTADDWDTPPPALDEKPAALAETSTSTPYAAPAQTLEAPTQPVQGKDDWDASSLPLGELHQPPDPAEHDFATSKPAIDTIPSLAAASSDGDEETGDGPFGPGSALPSEDASGPAGWLKGNADSMLFHGTDSPYYNDTDAEVWFKNEQSARMAGFRHWDTAQH